MVINLKTGVDTMLFGMKEQDVKGLYGEPDKQFKDDDKNVIYLYNDKKLRLTFYQDEGYKLGYIIVSHPDSRLFNKAVIGEKWSEMQGFLKENKLSSFENESFDTVDNYFNEDNWVIFQVEYNEIIRVEIGATINSKDEFDWKF